MGPRGLSGVVVRLWFGVRGVRDEQVRAAGVEGPVMCQGMYSQQGLRAGGGEMLLAPAGQAE